MLVELTHDRIVDVPFTQRQDEIGDIAKATDIFKDSIAEKVANFRIKTGLDDIASNVMIDRRRLQHHLHQQGDWRAWRRRPRPTCAGTCRIRRRASCSAPASTSSTRIRRSSAKCWPGSTTSHEDHIAIANRKLPGHHAPVIDKNGTRLGYLVEWKDETAEKAIEDGGVARSCRRQSPAISAAASRSTARRLHAQPEQVGSTRCSRRPRRCSTISSTMLSALAHGDLTKRIDADYQGTFGQLKNDANAMAERLTTIVSQIKAGAARGHQRVGRDLRPAPPTCRSAPRSRRRAWSRPRPRWRRFPRR